jgi:hypothetical protein
VSAEKASNKRAWLRAYYYREREAYRHRRREWIKQNRERHRNTQFERKIRELPESIKDMRRALRNFRIWCRENGHKYRSLAD